MCTLTAVSTIIGNTYFFSNAEAEDNPPLAQIIENRVFVNISLDDDDDDDDDDDNDNLCREPWGL